MADEHRPTDPTVLPPDVVAQMDQSTAAVNHLVAMVVDHWEHSGCPGQHACLGTVAYNIGAATEHAPANVGNALQAAVRLLAQQEYDRRHP